MFFGRTFDKGVPEYGNTPIRYNKDTGEYQQFYMGDIDNLDLYQNSDDVMIPDDFIIQD